MKIAFYMHDLSGGGVERMRLHLLPALQRLGASLMLVLHRRAGPLADAIPPGVEVVELGGSRTALDVPRLGWLMRQAAPDVLISSLDHNNVAAMLARLLAGTGTRLIICQHNTLSREAEAGEASPEGWSYQLIPRLYRHLCFAADAVVAVSQGVAKDLERTAGLPAGKIRVIPNPVIDAGFTARANAKLPPGWDGWMDDPAVPVFIAMGRLVAQKDPRTLLHAFARHRAGRPARLLLLGDGPLREDLQGLAAGLGLGEDLRMPGWQANPLPFLRRAEALVLSSRFEGLGNVIIEALGCGTPVISTDCPHGPAEILRDGQHGVLVPVGDADALADAMGQPLRARWPAEALMSRARDYTAATAALRILSLCLNVTAQGRPRRRA